MRPFALFIALILILTGCSPEAENTPTTSPATTTPEISVLSDPIADSRILGPLHTVGDMSRLAPTSEVKISRDLNADWVEKSGAAPIAAKNLEQLLVAGKPVAPNDKVIDGWSYAPWCRAAFVGSGRKWSAALYLGGLGVITDDAGQKGAFRFDVPRVPRGDGR